MRRAARVDANQAVIVAALLKAGASVWVIGLPVDLLVGYRGHTVPAEVKMLTGKRNPKPEKFTALQVDFISTWRGSPVATLTSVEDALALLRCLQ